MRLKSIYISRYKNFVDFKLDFDSESFIDVFVGKNGSGKSNFFEALIEIFQHLYEMGNMAIDFDYILNYEINGKLIEISYNDKEFKINKEKRKSLGSKSIPDNILIYYSGHNNKVSDLVTKYESSFKGKIKTADNNETRKFIGIGKEYKQLLLSMILILPDSNKAKQFVCKKLAISKIDKAVRLVLTRPYYADSKKYDIINNDETDRFWKAEGITKDFLNSLMLCSLDDSKGPVREEGYFNFDHSKYPDQYVYYFDINKIQKQFKSISSQELFRQFDNLKTIEMLDDISIKIKFIDGVEIDINRFSDGQFQSVYIYSIIELFKDKNCITLLDEPDSFLHPEWQFEFLKQIFEITDTTAKNNHILMSSHSAATLIPHEKNKIKFFDIKNNYANCYELPKQVAIKKLSSDLIKYSEQEQLLSIINTIQIENKPVFFTEGSSDPIIIKQAWYKLFEDEIPFIPFYAFSCTYLSQLLTDVRIHSEMGGLPVFGMFDFDQAYNQWNGINGDTIIDDPFKGLIKKWASGNSYAIMLPVPLNETIQKQVIKNTSTKETFKDKSCCEIEHLFYGSQITYLYFQEEPCVGGTQIVFKSDSDKTFFAKEIIPKVENEYFERFRPMFEFIKSKC